jgi:hypothetical protein
VTIDANSRLNRTQPSEVMNRHVPGEANEAVAEKLDAVPPQTMVQMFKKP